MISDRWGSRLYVYFPTFLLHNRRSLEMFVKQLQVSQQCERIEEHQPNPNP